MYNLHLRITTNTIDVAHKEMYFVHIIYIHRRVKDYESLLNVSFAEDLAYQINKTFLGCVMYGNGTEIDIGNGRILSINGG